MKITKTNYKKLEKQCLLAIAEYGIVFFDELFCVLDTSPAQLRQFSLEESETIKNALEANRAKLKRDLRLKWFESTNATMNVTLYKLVCSSEERRSLSTSSGTKTDNTDTSCTQEDYLKSLREMGECLDTMEITDSAD